MTKNKTQPNGVSVPDFVDALPDETKRADVRTLIELFARVTGENARMWGPSIIGFGSEHYSYESGREGDSPLACFSPRESAIVLYGITAVNGAEALLANLGKHTIGGGCLYIKKLADVDVKALEALVTSLVELKRSRRLSTGD